MGSLEIDYKSREPMILREGGIKMGNLLDSAAKIGKYHIEHEMPCQDRAIAVMNHR
jgi:hypothetical protein